MKRLLMFVLVLAGLASFACGAAPVGPTPPPPAPPACQVNNTGTLIANVNNQAGQARRIKMDSTDYGIVAWGASKSFTVNAGLAHSLQWVSVITGTVATSTSQAIVNQCGTLSLSDSSSTALAVVKTDE